MGKNQGKIYIPKGKKTGILGCLKYLIMISGFQRTKKVCHKTRNEIWDI